MYRHLFASAIVRSLSLCLASIAIPLHASDWQTPTPAELSMTSDPAAPGAPAVYLYREETSDDKIHMHSLYVRIKVLTEKGKSYADVEIPAYNGRAFSVDNVEARTIHPDGTVIPLTGKPIEKILMREGDQRVKSVVFSLPSVEPGSILEYRYKLRYDQYVLASPSWYIQQPIFMHKAHYYFVPSQSSYITGGKHDDAVTSLTYEGRLPAGASVKSSPNSYTLDVHDVPALPDESYMPPVSSLSYRLIFYYTSTASPDEYWKREGKYWSKDVNRFANSSPAMHAAVQQLTAPADTPEQKLRKLYAAVMALENTSFTREHTAAENKAEGLKVKAADDIWTQKRGTSDEMTRLFIALARAGGFKAYDMTVVNRDRDLLVTDYMDWDQLDDEIAIVSLNGVDTYFDPGQRYAEFGKLHWKHTGVQGVRQTDNGTVLAASGSISYKDNAMRRLGDLEVADNGEISGTIRFLLTGAAALHWRQRALEVDPETLRRDYEQSVQSEFPVGTQAKVDHFIGLTDPDHVLMIIVKVQGVFGTMAGHRLLMPASFFTDGGGTLFPQQTRQTYVDLHYPSIRQDKIIIKLAPGMKMENVPKDGDLSLPNYAAYSNRFLQTGDVYTLQRTFLLANALYSPAEYPSLREFYQKVDVKDEEQAVINMAPATASSSGTNGSGKVTQ